MGPKKCGNVHSMRWYKNEERVFVFSSRAKISRAENSLASRAVLDYTQDSTEAYLVIDKVDLRDEGLYKCDITYLNIHDDCKGINFINFTTLVKPENITIYDEEMIVPDGKYDKVLTEDDDITLTCVGGRGKPVPSVQWWRGGEFLNSVYEEEKDENGVGVGTNKLKFRVSRADLNVKFECRVYHPALDGYISTHTQLEVNVRPNKLVLSGVEHHVVQGTTVLLKCEVFGARPPAVVKWFNATIELVPEHNSTKFNEGDGTYNTSSTLVFTATRFENDASITCEAENEIMDSRDEVPLRETLKLEVLYPPLVNVSPEKEIVNESFDILMFCVYEANPATILDVKWYKDDEELDLDPDHYEGGILDNLSLLVKNSTRDDMGLYKCSLTNEVGTTRSNKSVNVSVHYKPEVEVTMDPASPIVEDIVTNVTLSCNVMAGNPPNLVKVRWFINGSLIEELPNCRNESLCVDDPSKLLLMNIDRDMHGNYSCMGKNAAGWGLMSASSELVIYYPPSKISLTYHPQRVVKRGSVTLICSVLEIGRPSNTTYRWTRGSHTVMDITTANWTIDPVTLETESNFTCTAVNLGGESESATVYIRVDAPPTFIERLTPYFGALMTSQNISISCRVECSPICSIRWMKGSSYLDTSSRTRYYVENTVKPPDTRTNDFQSAHSTLYWNMTAWPGGYLDRMTDNANYTCVSTGNAVGGGVKSTTLFAVEYPPENLTLSNKVVNVIEGNIPEKVICNSKSFPEPTYQWRREGESDVIVKGNALILNHPVSKRNGGNYTCEAVNRHGNNSMTAFINVLYRPECGITKKEVDGKLILMCTAQANPPEVDFAWKIKNENETVEDNIEKKGMQSILTLETRVENFRTYLCFPNNSVGVTLKPCEVDVSELNTHFKTENISQESNSSYGSSDKSIPSIVTFPIGEGSPSDSLNLPLDFVSYTQTENPLDFGETVAGTVSWWLRLDKEIIMILIAILTGIILVIIIICIIICIVCRRKQAADKYNTPVELEDRENPEGSCTNNNNNVPGGTSTPMTAAKWPMRPGVLVHVNTNHSLLSSTPNGRSPNESQASRASRIRAMFGPDQPGGSLPGVFHSKSGVVTFKRLEPSSETNSLNRKRKKPGGTAGPNPSGNKDLASPNDALLPSDADKAFYENLPFHNMANPQNKASRPPSRISSGYGSSRSQKIARPARKFLTVRPLGSKPRNWPQFRSLRLTKSKNTPPVPAPRQYFPKTSLAYHSYQNVPPPKKAVNKSADKNATNERGNTPFTGDDDAASAVNTTSPNETARSSLPSVETLPTTSGGPSSQVTHPFSSVYKQPPQKPLQIPSLKVAASPPTFSNLPSIPSTQAPTSIQAVQLNDTLPVKVSQSPPTPTPKPCPLTLSVASLIASNTPSKMLPVTTIDTKKYPVSRTPSITSQTSRPAKPKLTYSTHTVTTPVVRHPSNSQKTPGALLLARLSPASPKKSTSEKEFQGIGRTSSMLVTKRPQPTSTSPSMNSTDKSSDPSPTTVRLLKPSSLPPSTSIVRRLSEVLRSDSSTGNRVPVITGVVPKKFDMTPPEIGKAALDASHRLSKSDSEDPKVDERMMNGEPSTGSRHHHSHTHHSGGRTRRKHHRRSDMDNCRYRPGSAPASPPPGNRYTSPDSPPQNPYPTPHYPTYTAPRSKADYTFIKFHDVGQEIDV